MMDFKNAIHNWIRICEKYTGKEYGCDKCPLFGHCAWHHSRDAFPVDFPDGKEAEEVERIIEDWYEDNREKTRYDDLLQKYPGVMVAEDGVPMACCHILGYVSAGECDHNCAKCWKTPLPKEEQT